MSNISKNIITGFIITITLASFIITFNTVRLRIEVNELTSRVDSLENYSNVVYKNTPTFESKSPKEGIDEALLYYGIKHPTIVKAQAILETGHFTSNLCIKNNNLFGLYDNKNKRYYSYNYWWESIIAYKEIIQKRYDNSKYYYMFLEDIKYAEDKEYINKLKKIAEELE